MSQQSAANSRTLYTQTLPITSVSGSLQNVFTIPFTYKYTIEGNNVSLFFSETVGTATAISTFMAAPLLPTEIRPARDIRIPVIMSANAGPVSGYLLLTTTGGMVFIYLNGVISAVGQTCGVAGASIHYSLL